MLVKKYVEDVNVLDAARQRIAWTFDEFESICVSYSAGKDSTVMLHLVADEARRRGRRFNVLLIDLEGQYQTTIGHATAQLTELADVAEVWWVCLPLMLRNAVSVFEPRWQCWDPDVVDSWIRPFPEIDAPHIHVVTNPEFFEFFNRGMEFEEFVPLFGEWVAKHMSEAKMPITIKAAPRRTASFVGIRAQESMNRFRTIVSLTKRTWKGQQFTTRVSDNVYNVYPIYDWNTEDIWTYHGQQPDRRYNRLYDLMGMAGLSIHQMRICQPYGDDQRRGLWLFSLIEPDTWARVVARVSGANGGSLYVNERGNVTGYNSISLPAGHTWQSFAQNLMESMPPAMAEHYQNKVLLFQRWWVDRGYPDGIPDTAPADQEAARSAPSWRRVCKALLRNDYWCKGLGFSQTKSDAYSKYQDLMRRRKQDWGVTDQDLAVSQATFGS